MKRILLASCIIFLCISIQSLHAQKKKKSLAIEEYHDKFEGTRTYTMKGNKVKINNAVKKSIGKGALSALMSGRLQISASATLMNLENHFTKNNKSELSVILVVNIHDDDNFYIGKGESLILLADGERINLSTNGEFNSNYSGYTNLSKTHARYPITRKIIEKIINAKEVEFRILQGSYKSRNQKERDKKETSFEGSFSSKNLNLWKRFYQEYIINKPNKS